MDFLRPDQVLSDAESLQTYGRDWTTYFDVKASKVVFPESTEEVQKLVQWARKTKTALVPSGGRTGLSGGAVATRNEVIVSLERMNKILHFDPVDRLAHVQAGVITESLQEFAQEKNLQYPVDFAASGSSQIGGNIATNAGGIKVLRYGMTRQWIAGLTAILGTGERVDLNHGLIKNASGYDLRQLLIGSEGTLGIVTEALVQLTQPQPASQVLLLALAGMDSVMQVFQEFNAQTQLCAFEVFSELALSKVLHNTGLVRPFSEAHPFYVVLEAEEGDEVLAAFEKCVEKAWVLDGNLAQSPQQATTFWRYREDISESLAKFSPYKNDISVRISRVPSFMQELDGVLKKAYPNWEVVWFGHIGDGNLHINILRPDGMSKEAFVTECQKVDALVFSTVQKFVGSISAEHGVGLTKKPFLGFSRTPAEIQLFKGIKKTFDPDGILNPGKILD